MKRLCGSILWVSLAGCRAADEPVVTTTGEDDLGGPASTSPAGFDQLDEGALPPGWRIESTGSPRENATWSVRRDPDASSAPNVFALTRTNHASQDAFNLCWTDGLRFGEGVLEVSVRADGGEVDQGGGPIWRARDADNYYVCRFNPLESNFRVYVVEDGKRKQLGTARFESEAGDWHRVRVEHVGSRIACSLDDQPLLEVDDATLSGEGGVGFWTKADARTSFDDLSLP
jgi:hypothetical protein